MTRILQTRAISNNLHSCSHGHVFLLCKIPNIGVPSFTRETKHFLKSEDPIPNNSASLSHVLELTQEREQ